MSQTTSSTNDHMTLAAEMVKLMITQGVIKDPASVPDLLVQISKTLGAMKPAQAVGAPFSVKPIGNIRAALKRTAALALPETPDTGDVVTAVDNGASFGWTLRKASEHGDKPFVAIRDSVTPGAIICLEDGRPMKMMKRHIRAVYGMTAEQYLWRWDLPANYPLVAPAYAKQKSNYARTVGLGTHGMREAVAVSRASAQAAA